MTVRITNLVRIQENPEFCWYTVEDAHYVMGECGDYCTISSWSTDEDGDKRITHVCMNPVEALAIADAIYKLFKKD